MRGGGNMKRYLITTKDLDDIWKEEHTSMVDTKTSAIGLLSSITSNNQQELVSVIEVDINSAQAVKLEPFLNENFKFDLREK